MVLSDIVGQTPTRLKNDESQDDESLLDSAPAEGGTSASSISTGYNAEQQQALQHRWHSNSLRAQPSRVGMSRTSGGPLSRVLTRVCPSVTILRLKLELPTRFTESRSKPTQEFSQKSKNENTELLMVFIAPLRRTTVKNTEQCEGKSVFCKGSTET